MANGAWNSGMFNSIGFNASPGGIRVKFDLGEPTDPRQIVVACELFSERLIQHLADHPSEMYRLHDRRFEELVACLWDGLGWEVELTARTRDGGYDVLAIRRTELQLRYLIECKRYSTKNKVGVRPVRELLGVKVHEGANKGVLVTTASFTRGARILLDQHPWDLEGHDFNELQRWLRRCTGEAR